MTHPLRAALFALTLCAVAGAQQPGSIPAGRYVQSTNGNLKFLFTQVGAASVGEFRDFKTQLVYDESNLAASSLDVTIQIASLDTADGERDGVLAGEDLFHTAKYPQARYVASSLAKGADGALEAVGKLTLRGVTRDLRLPLKLEKKTGAHLLLTGKTTIRRLDYGVGQGEWKSTESVADLVEIRYVVNLVKGK